MLVSVPGLMISTSPCQPNISIHDTNVGYIPLNRLIALLQNAVCILLTHLGKFLVTQPRCNRGKNYSIQTGAVGWSLQLSLWGPQKCSEKLIQLLCSFLWIFRAQANLNYTKPRIRNLPDYMVNRFQKLLLHIYPSDFRFAKLNREFFSHAIFYISLVLFSSREFWKFRVLHHKDFEH